MILNSKNDFLKYKFELGDKFMTTRILMTALLASSVIYVPVEANAAEKRKTLFQVLFKKAHESKQRKKQRLQKKRLQQQAARKVQVKKPKVKKVAKKERVLAKVESSKNYTYRVSKRALITLTAAPVSYAAVQISTSEQNQKNINISELTADIVKAGNMQMRAEKHLATTISEYYDENQNYLWIDKNGEWNSKAKAALKILSQAENYGLRAADYEIGETLISPDLNSKALAREKISREISLSTAVLRYAMDARFGTVNPNLLSGYHDFPVHYDKAPDMLSEISNSPVLFHTLQSFHPSNDKFAVLKRELIALRNADDDAIKLDPKTFLKPGREHDELPNIISAIKKRGSAELLEKHSTVLNEYYGYFEYTKELVGIVKSYQKEVGLSADGIIGRNTIFKLAGVSQEAKAKKLLLAMERLRWHPDQFGERHVFVNQPEYRARYIEDGKEALSMRVVVGKKSNQTNFFYDEIEHVTYNPYWGVPRSIIVNEFAPKSISNPAYLDQRGYELKTWGGKRLNSTQVNWSSIGTKPNFSVRQKPGPKNALGKLKIMFPNKHAIYMHDTPARGLFNKDYRAYSHGCIRLHDPQAMAAAVLGKNRTHVNSKINPGKNNTEKLNVKVPVYVSYFTAWPQEDGTVKYFADVYERDAHLLKAFQAIEKARSINISS